MSHLLGYVLLILMLPVTAWMIWPWLRRWRPLTLAPVDGDSHVGAYAPSAPPSTNSETVERLQRELSEAERKLANFDGDRKRFKSFLLDARSEGIDLRANDPSEEQAKEWEGHVKYLIECAVGKEIAEKVLTHEPHYDAQKYIAIRLDAIDRLSENVAQSPTIPFRPGFDPHKWEDWKSPPPTAEQAQIGKLTAMLHKVKQERDSLRGEVQELRMMSPDEFRTRQEHRRKRIEGWRAEIRASDFKRTALGASQFAHTETYSEMRPYLLHDVRVRFESAFGTVQTIIAAPRHQGSAGDKRVLLDEVSRIEKEWGIV